MPDNNILKPEMKIKIYWTYYTYLNYEKNEDLNVQKPQN